MKIEQFRKLRVLLVFVVSQKANEKYPLSIKCKIFLVVPCATASEPLDVF